MDTLKPLDYAVIVFVAWMIRAHITLILMFGQNAPLSGVVTVDIGYRVTWDEEHTLCARIRDGQLLELCGNVLVP